MKIAVMNYTGTVGKTTIAAHLLSPRMSCAEVFAIESINESASGLGIDVETIKGEKFKDLFKKLLTLTDAIIDVGASNVEDFLNGMVKAEDSHLEFDLFLVPVTKGSKEQIETIKFINTLSSFDIPAEKIKLVFNRVEEEVEEEFARLFNFAKKENKCIANPEAAIFENELFDMAAVKKITITAILNDANDYKAMLRELGKDGDKKLVSHYADMHYMKAAAKSVNRNLDNVFAVLTA
jgi:MinD-like ATPase involved in chromosome partitioning or flagellar assembly